MSDEVSYDTSHSTSFRGYCIWCAITTCCMYVVGAGRQYTYIIILCRSSKNARSWRLRYFILNQSYLYYYRSDAEVGMRGLAMFDAWL